MARASERPGAGGGERRNPLEIGVLVLSALLVAGSIALLVWKAARDERPPELTARVDSAVARGGTHLVHVTVRNDGDVSVGAAHVRGRLRRDTVVVAEAETVVDWVPGRSAERATLLFDEDPRRHELDVRVVGYTEP